MTEKDYELLETAGGVPVKAWIRGVAMEDEARRQLQETCRLAHVSGRHGCPRASDSFSDGPRSSASRGRAQRPQR